MRPTALVMNMYYTGLGIARSLGEQRIPVVGLTSTRGIYGNYTRYARTVVCPDSKDNPEGLLDFLLQFRTTIQSNCIIFPTRDHDLIFLDRFRAELGTSYSLVIPERDALETCLDKWQAYRVAMETEVPTPRSWLVETPEQLQEAAGQVSYPCILKPVEAHHWRDGRNWARVGGRKVICAESREQLVSEYSAVTEVHGSALLQEMIPGEDDCLVIAACYLDKESNFVAGFNTRKLLQTPKRLGTGCIVQAVDCAELFDPAVRLLKAMRFSGIAEVEFKWDAKNQTYQFIEVNPRPWDQHRLGKGCGVDLAFQAYCEHAGLPFPRIVPRRPAEKWIAEDAFANHALTTLWAGDGGLLSLFRLARGRRIYAIWSIKDPLPAIIYFTVRLIPDLARRAIKALRGAMRRRWARRAAFRDTGERAAVETGNNKVA